MDALNRIEAVRAADEAARRAFHSALCDGATYAEAYEKGAVVYRAAMARLLS